MLWSGDKRLLTKSWLLAVQHKKCELLLKLLAGYSNITGRSLLANGLHCRRVSLVDKCVLLLVVLQRKVPFDSEWLTLLTFGLLIFKSKGGILWEGRVGRSTLANERLL